MAGIDLSPPPGGGGSPTVVDPSAIYGTGVDGDLVISANTQWTPATLAAGVYNFQDLTIDAGATLKVGGDASMNIACITTIFVNGTLTLEGTIDASPSWLNSRFAGCHGTDGGDGGTAAGSAGTAAAPSLGGAGGAGGTGSGGAGGAGGTAQAFVSGTSTAGGLEDGVFRNIAKVLMLPRVVQNNGLSYQVRGGAGGGGGGGDGTKGGIAGHGGGLIIILARHVAGAGTVDASGKDGTAATAGNRGGGGGGGGGCIIIYTEDDSVPWTLDVTGGAGGAGFGTGTAGTAGSAGNTVVVTGVA